MHFSRRAAPASIAGADLLPLTRRAAGQVGSDYRPLTAARAGIAIDYVAKVTAAANSLVARRVLLPQDTALMIQQANTGPVP